MFVRKNQNRTGTTSVPIIDKAGGAYRVVRAIGSSRHPDETKRLIQQAYDGLHSVQHDKQSPLFARFTPRDTTVQNFLATSGNGSVCRERIAAEKDAYNPEGGLRKRRQRVKTGKLAKEDMNNRGYNNFLTLKGEVEVTIDDDKVDEKWDGLKGYITNTSLRSRTVVENYRHL